MLTWKRISFYSWAVIAVLVILLTFKGCGKNTEYIVTTIPAVKGSFPVQEPAFIPQEKPVIVKWKDREFELPNEINDSINKLYLQLAEAKDSIAQYKMWLNAIQIRNYKNHFEDEYLTLDIYTEAQGHVRNVRTEYEIKEREIVQEIERSRLRILFGGQIGFNQDFDSFVYKADLSFQNSKNRTIDASYMRLNGQNYGLIGGKILLFQIR